MHWESSKTVQELIRQRIEDDLCPICGKTPQPPCKLIHDGHFQFESEAIKICVSHIVEY